VFGISLTEIIIIAIVALVVVGPQKLPGMLRTLGEWIGKLRRLTSEVRAQTGIDEILRSEGIDGGLGELRGMLRGDFVGPGRGRPRPADDPYRDVEADVWREYPVEGPDSYDALPDDLVDTDAGDEPPVADADATSGGPRRPETSA
jgi:sec-independent protein translocase protein TatB